MGTWKSSDGQVYAAVKEALKIGYRHIDCAPVYGNEKEVGQSLNDAIKESHIKREEIFLTSKLWNDRHFPEDVIPALKQTLTDLQAEYLDLFLIHWPISFKKGVNFATTAQEFISLEELPLIETWKAMEKAVHEGLVRNIGVSNFSIKKLKNLQSEARIQPCMNQVESHPFLQQDELLAYCQAQNIGFTAYSPLGSMDRKGFLKADDEPILIENPVIKRIATKHQTTPAQVLIQWAIKRGTIVIPKSVSPERIQENFDAQKIDLDAEDMIDIKGLNKNFRYVNGTFFLVEGSSYTLETIWDEAADLKN